MSQVFKLSALAEQIAAGEWIKAGEVAKRTGWRLPRVALMAMRAGVRRLNRPGHKPLYHARDVDNLNVSIDDYVVGPGIGTDRLPLSAPSVHGARVSE